jgi:hypothetical protein
LPFIGHCNNRASFSHCKIGPGHPGLGLHDQRPGVLAHHLGQVNRIGLVLIGAIYSGKERGYILRRLVPGRTHDMTGRFIVELLYAFAEIRLGDPDAAILEKAPCIAFLG